MYSSVSGKQNFCTVALNRIATGQGIEVGVCRKTESLGLWDVVYRLKVENECSLVW